MKLIGKGQWTKCYLKDPSTVLLVSSCQVKESMSCGFFPESRYFPIVNSTNKRGEYTMKYYPRLRGGIKKHLIPEDWEFYKQLRKVHNECLIGVDELRDYFRTNLPNDKSELMIGAAEACANYDYDEVRFEISPRNIAIDNNQLILLDTFYIPE